MRQETDGAVDKASKKEKLKAWLASQGVKLPRRPKKQKSGLQWEDLSRGRATSRSSWPETCRTPACVQRSRSGCRRHNRRPAKSIGCCKTRCADGRVRNLYKIYGAITGRWSGEGFQPQNLKRPELLQDRRSHRRSDRNGVGRRLRRHQGTLRRRAGRDRGPVPQHACPGAGASFHRRGFQRDRGARAGLPRRRRGQARELSANSISASGGTSTASRPSRFSGSPTCRSKSPERQLGKIFELGLGYSMGADRLLATIRKANVPNAAAITIARTRRDGCKHGAPRIPRIVAYWAALDAPRRWRRYAIPECLFPAAPSSFKCVMACCSLRLPSGRELSYPAPVHRAGPFRQTSRSRSPTWRRDGGAGRQMYGGAWAENVTSAVARDLLVEAMKRLRAAGYKLVMHTHDEIVAEMPIGRRQRRRSSSACSSRCRPGRRGCRSRRRCSSAIGSRRIDSVRSPCLEAR